jgi:N-formylglutamate deformylase
MNKFPILISIPHGGTEMPAEIAPRVCITPKDQFEDGDALTREIYGIKNEVLSYVEGTIARAFVDLNRDVSDRPPKNPDGVVKSMTCFGKPIYHPDQQLDNALTDLLLKKYYLPYHQSIRTALDSQKNLALMLDCHTMEAVGPKISPDPGNIRPKFCLGSNHEESCPAEMVQRMAHCIKTAFALNDDDVVIDKPFAGGFITRTYGNKPIPCIQIEMSRGLYLADPWFDKEQLKVISSRLAQLRQYFRDTLELFFVKDRG